MTTITKDTEFDISQIHRLDFDIEIVPDSFEILTKEEGEQERTMVAVISSANVDRVGDRILPGAFSNVKLGQKSSIPLLWGHDRSGYPVGKSQWIKNDRKNKTVIGKFEFASTTKALEAWELVEQGFITKVSVGFNVTSQDALSKNDFGGYDIKSAELLEVSLVNIPANRDAVIQGIKQLMENKSTFCDSTLKEFGIIDDDEPEVEPEKLEEKHTCTIQEVLGIIEGNCKYLQERLKDKNELELLLKQLTNAPDQSVMEVSGEDAAISFDLESEVEKSGLATATSDGDEQELIILIDDGEES